MEFLQKGDAPVSGRVGEAICECVRSGPTDGSEEPERMRGRAKADQVIAAIARGTDQQIETPHCGLRLLQKRRRDIRNIAADDDARSPAHLRCHGHAPAEIAAGLIANKQVMTA